MRHSQEAIRSVTHLVLVPSGKLHLKSFPFPGTQSRILEIPKTFSAKAAFIQFLKSSGSSQARKSTCASNPLVTRVLVESLSKTCSLRVVVFQVESGRLQSVPKGFSPTPSSGWRPLSRKLSLHG